MTEIPEGAEYEWLEDKLWRDYRAHLAAHPDPRDPDHPDPEAYLIYEKEDDEDW